jgi:HSP20 family protein
MTLVSVKPQFGRHSFPKFSNWFDTFSEGEFSKDLFDNVRTPALVNTKETKDSYKISIAAPGFNKDNFKLEVNDLTLTISAENTENKTDESEKWTRKEYHFAGFKRSFSLPKTVDADKITAEYKDGILHVTLPKQEESKAKTAVEIKVS